MRVPRRSPRKKAVADVAEAIVHSDLNMAAAALLYDMAALQSTSRSQFGYKRAAKAIVGLPVSVADLVTAGALRDVPFIGPSSAKIITEVVKQGHSPTVDAAVANSTRGADVVLRRGYRSAFLSHFALQRALGEPLGDGTVRRADYRGDFQMHSTWSDGAESIATMANACMELGHTCLGITDHSYGLPIAGGVSMADVVRQQKEIDKLNSRSEGRFRIFKGIEANILADGALDLQPEERTVFEFVVASPHSVLRRTHDQTARMVGAVRAAGVAILGHPRGRMFNNRPGVSADWPRVFEAAAERQVAIELDGNWHRQDIDYELARHAWTPAASSRSTATHTRLASFASASTRSHTRGSRAFPGSA